MGKRKLIERVMDWHYVVSEATDVETQRMVFTCACTWAGEDHTRHVSRKIDKALKKRQRKQEEADRSYRFPAALWLTVDKGKGLR